MSVHEATRKQSGCHQTKISIRVNTEQSRWKRSAAGPAASASNARKCLEVAGGCLHRDMLRLSPPRSASVQEQHAIKPFSSHTGIHLQGGGICGRDIAREILPGEV